MDFQVRITQSALEDFEEILAYSRANFPSATERFGNAVLDHLDLLKPFPYVGSPVAGHPGIRQLVHTPIVIYYRVDEDTDDRWNARPVDQFTVTKPQASLNVQFSVPATCRAEWRIGLFARRYQCSHIPSTRFRPW